MLLDALEMVVPTSLLVVVEMVVVAVAVDLVDLVLVGLVCASAHPFIVFHLLSDFSLHLDQLLVVAVPGV